MVGKDLYNLYLDAVAGVSLILLGLIIGVMLADSYLVSKEGLVVTSVFMVLFFASLKDYRDRRPKTFLGRREALTIEQKTHFWSAKSQKIIMIIAVLAIPFGWILTSVYIT